MDWIRRHRTEVILAATVALFLGIQQLFFPLRPALFPLDYTITNFQATKSLLTYYREATAEIVSLNSDTNVKSTSTENYNFIQNLWFSPLGERFAATTINDQPASSANPLYVSEKPMSEIVSVVYTPATQTRIALPRVIATAIWINETTLLYQEVTNKKSIFVYDLSKQKESTALTLAQDSPAILVRQLSGEIAVVQGATLLELDSSYKLKNRLNLPVSNITSLTYASPTTLVAAYQDKNSRPKLTKFDTKTNKSKPIILRRMPRRGAVSSLQNTGLKLYFICNATLYQSTLRSL